MTTIELSDQEAEHFKRFRLWQQDFDTWHKNWLEVIEFSKKLDYGSVTLTIQDGLPVKLTNPMQQIIIGLHLTK
ncbi:MAG TPA: DUF2292 domain-containing protein [Patescibacteria group bacterium]